MYLNKPLELFRSSQGGTRGSRVRRNALNEPRGVAGGGAAGALSLLVLMIGAGVAAADTSPHRWGYQGAHGPEHWAADDEAYATCGDGKRQSPINIERAVKKELPRLEFSYQPIPLRISDTGHSFQVNTEPGAGGITVGGQHYDFQQLHFHQPSEERMHGRRYSMEAHLVHGNAKGELVVVAILIRRGKANAALEPVFDHFPAAGTKETVVAGTTLNIGDLLPLHQGYFTFEGSLTTPPCSENVRWFVLKSAIDMSERQLRQFGIRYGGNARPTQNLNGRVVEATRD